MIYERMRLTGVEKLFRESDAVADRFVAKLQAVHGEYCRLYRSRLTEVGINSVETTPSQQYVEQRCNGPLYS